MYSFIIPLFNSPFFKIQCDAFSQISSSDFECIFVDDGSTLFFQDIYKKTLEKVSFSFSFFSLSPKGGNENRVTQARNKGVEKANYQYIILIDQDTLIAPLYILQLKNIFPLAEKNIVLGSYLGYNNLVKSLSKDSLREFLKSGTIQDPRFLDFRSGNKKLLQQEEIWKFFCGSHLLMHKESFIDIGGFDETINSWGDEDVEFGYRAFKMNYYLTFLDTLEVLNLSSKLYQTPYNIVEAKDVSSLSENWYKNIKKHKTREYVLYVKNRYQGLPDLHKTFVYPDLISFLRHENF